MDQATRLEDGRPTSSSSAPARWGWPPRSSLGGAACAASSSSATIGSATARAPRRPMSAPANICAAGALPTRCAQASPISPDRPITVVFATRMNGHFLARFENALNGSRERNNLYSEEAQWVPQYVLEDVLRQRAQSLEGVAVHFETEFLSFEQSASGVDARCRDLRNGRIADVGSAYLIGADGARSMVRDAIGATMDGRRRLLAAITASFSGRLSSPRDRCSNRRSCIGWSTRRCLRCWGRWTSRAVVLHGRPSSTSIRRHSTPSI